MSVILSRFEAVAVGGVPALAKLEMRSGAERDEEIKRTGESNRSVRSPLGFARDDRSVTMNRPNGRVFPSNTDIK